MEKLTNTWWLSHLREKPDKVVAKLYDGENFVDAVNIPSLMWPLSGPYEVFHWNNCELIQDPKVEEIVNSVPYQIGYCYTNTESVVNRLTEAGYAVKYYVGWMFTCGSEHPLHHAWAVLDGIHVIDLAEDFALLNYNKEKFAGASKDESRLLMVSFQKWAQQFPHSQRCMPFGIPAPSVLYVGCESSRLAGIGQYKQLMERFPDHPCTNPVVASGRTITQELMAKAGLK